MSDCWATIYENVQTVLCPIVQWLTRLCPIIKRLDNALSNCPMVGQCCVQHSSGWSMLCSTVRWLVSWVGTQRLFLLHGKYVGTVEVMENSNIYWIPKWDHPVFSFTFINPFVQSNVTLRGLVYIYQIYGLNKSVYWSLVNF